MKSAEKTQTYLNEFHLNDQLAVVALCSPTSLGNIVIYLWAPIEKVCDEKQSLFFFKKYIDYIENQTTFKSIMYCG
jgi:lipid II:glycine glycyltransferase (peptidoglycan interpeptide bridge formation enzyme)